MAAYIFHGPPGSYKTSSAIWFEMLSSLRAGRIVITNIEGMRPIEEIQTALGEEFPEGAEIWRLSTQKEKGRELMRAFYHWAPIGAMIIVDEVQDVYPSSRKFKPEDYDYVPIEAYEGHIPDHWYKKHFELLDSIKPSDLTSADIDDLEQVTFNESGHIIYPSTLNESYMRHRKYNWDIVVCTPSIAQVNSSIREACELAFSHSSKDTIGKMIPYYKRRPRIRQHPPKENGMVARKSDLITFRKVPVKVHDLYKSTATGKITTSGVGNSPAGSGVMAFLLFLIVGSITFASYSLFFRESAVASSMGATSEAVSVNGEVRRAGNQKGADVSSGPGGLKANSEAIANVMPFNFDAMSVTRRTKIYRDDGILLRIEFTIAFYSSDNVYYLDDTQLSRYGVSARFIDDCMVELLTPDSKQLITCSRPVLAANPKERSKTSISVF